MLGHELTNAYTKEHFYVVVVDGEGPFMEIPRVRPNPKRPSAILINNHPAETIMRVFVSLEDACEYKEYQEEGAHAQFSIKRLTLEELVTVLGNLDKFSEEKHGYPLRVDLSVNEKDRYASSIDTIWSKNRTVH